jgi:hypothetical protein
MMTETDHSISQLDTIPWGSKGDEEGCGWYFWDVIYAGKQQIETGPFTVPVGGS